MCDTSNAFVRSLCHLGSHTVTCHTTEVILTLLQVHFLEVLNAATTNLERQLLPTAGKVSMSESNLLLTCTQSDKGVLQDLLSTDQQGTTLAGHSSASIYIQLWEI